MNSERHSLVYVESFSYEFHPESFLDLEFFQDCLENLCLQVT